jgi:LytS/YehU family sensor histidine kinase
MYFFVPQLLFKGYYFVYVISIVVIISLFYFLAFFIRNLLKPFVIDSQVASNSSGDFFFFLVIFSVIIAASTAIKLFQRSIIDGERINSLENLRLQSELDHLKNQVNPHFLFNTLNNANVLITKDPEKASTVLHSLSHLLRYQLYDSNRPLVLLNGEVKFLNNFLSLEKIRRDFFDFRITTTTNISKTLVPPYLFIAFVENAVKHSADPLSRSYVYIDVSIVESSLFFSCINSKPNFALNVNEAYGGLGLANVKRRLELLFAGKYTLNINEQIDKYQVHLALEL